MVIIEQKSKMYITLCQIIDISTWKKIHVPLVYMQN